MIARDGGIDLNDNRPAPARPEQTRENGRVCVIGVRCSPD